DHPDTQRAKRTRLQRAKIELEGVHFVATDFRESDLDGVMAEARFDRFAPTLFVWEGVTNYLDAASVDATLRWCGAAPAGSALIFTYIDRRALDDPSQFVGAERVFRTLGRTGERMTFGMAPDCLGSYVQGLGLTLVSDIGAAD